MKGVPLWELSEIDIEGFEAIFESSTVGLNAKKRTRPLAGHCSCSPSTGMPFACVYKIVREVGSPVVALFIGRICAGIADSTERKVAYAGLECAARIPGGVAPCTCLITVQI